MKRVIAAAAVAVAAVTCGPVNSCIARGARIRTPRGQRRIEELAVGDAIFCVNRTTGEKVETVITEIRVAKRECVSIDFEGGTLTCTSDHPLYCPETKTWGPAGDWVLGSRKVLLKIEDEGVKKVPVVTASTFAGLFDVYDLTVAHDFHNFVAEDILAHNKSIVRQCGPAQSVRDLDRCTCGDGTTGIIQCEEDGGATCQSCGLGGDGGTDAGVDGGP